MSPVRIMIILSLVSSLFTIARAQDADPPAGDARIVEFTWNAGLVNGILPFDHPFVFRVSGVPVEAKHIATTVYEVRGNFRLFRKRKNPHTIAYDDFIRMEKVYRYTLPVWDRHGETAEQPAYVQQPYWLKPNSNYIIVMEQREEQELSDADRSDISANIRLSTAVQNLIGRYVTKYRKKPGTSFSELNTLRDDLNKVIVSELKKLNDNYRFKEPPNENEQLTVVADFINAIIETDNELEDLKKDSIPEVTAFANAFARTNFAKYIFDLEKQDQLKEQLTAALDKTVDPQAKDELKNIADEIDKINTVAARLDKTIVEELVVENTFLSLTLATNYELTMTKQASNLIGLDFGAAYVGNFERIQTYYGVNIYLRPVNKNIPLSRYDQVGEMLLTRTSLLFGMTFASVAKENVRKGIVDDKGLILGAGFRVVSFLRVNAGGLIYYRNPRNPTLDPDRYTTKVSPFVSLSFDLDVKSLFGSVNGFFPADNE